MPNTLIRTLKHNTPSGNPIPYGRQHIDQADIDAVVATLQSDFLTQGPQVAAFEAAFAEYVGAKYAVAVANGTAALHLSAMALGVTRGTKAICTPITFAASSNAILYCGGEVDFADIDPKTALLDIESVKSLLESSPKGTYSGIVAVDFTGYPIDLEAFRELADEYGLWIIEDACHAPGGYFLDKKGQRQLCGNGRYADLAVFSFHPVKHIACGEGGMITTNNEVLYQKLLMLRTHGITKDPAAMQENHGGWYYEMQQLGFNYRMPDVLCALGLSQLAKADAGLARRQELAKKYDAAFLNNKNIEIFRPNEDVGHAYHLYIISVNDRKGLYDHLRTNGIYAQVHYIPVHTLPYYRQLGHQKGECPFAEAYYEGCLSIPMYPSLTDAEQAFVMEKILEFTF